MRQERWLEGVESWGRYAACGSLTITHTLVNTVTTAERQKKTKAERRRGGRDDRGGQKKER